MGGEGDLPGTLGADFVLGTPLVAVVPFVGGASLVTGIDLAGPEPLVSRAGGGAGFLNTLSFSGELGCEGSLEDLVGELSFEIGTDLDGVDFVEGVLEDGFDGSS